MVLLSLGIRIENKHSVPVDINGQFCLGSLVSHP